MGMLPHQRRSLIVLTACVAFAALLAEGFVLVNLDHAHAGEPCSVCLHLEAARHLLAGLGRLGLCAPALFLVRRAPADKNRWRFSVASPTLVALKIKNTS